MVAVNRAAAARMNRFQAVGECPSQLLNRRSETSATWQIILQGLANYLHLPAVVIEKMQKNGRGICNKEPELVVAGGSKHNLVV
jgi:hypothetical protein